MEKSQPKPKSHLPRRYIDNAFWRFVLDTKVGMIDPPGPRFRQFSENLRNYVVSGAVLKVGVSLLHSSRSGSDLVAAWLIIGLGSVAAILSEAQVFGLSLEAFHWYVGVAGIVIARKGRWARNFLAHSCQTLEVLGALSVPTSMVWLMYKFVTNSVWPVPLTSPH